MVRIRRRVPGVGGAAASPWPDGRDPLPPVVDVDAFGPLRSPAPEPLAGEAAVRPVRRLRVNRPEPVPVPPLEPELDDAPADEPARDDAALDDPDVDRWFTLPDDMWAPAAADHVLDDDIDDDDIDDDDDLDDDIDDDEPAVDEGPAPPTALLPPVVPIPPVPVRPAIEPLAADEPPPPRPPGSVSLASAALAMAAVVLLTGLLTVATGLTEDDGEVATGETSTTQPLASTTSTTSLGVTLPASGTVTTGTTSVPSSGDGDSTATTASPRVTLPSRTTPTTGGAQPTTSTTASSSPSSSTTTTLAPNQPMTVEMSWDEPVVAGEQATFNVEWTDPDAVPSAGCIEIVGGDGLSIEPVDCEYDPDCEEDPTIRPQGGVRTYSFNHTYSEAGTFEVTVRNRSGDPMCGNRYSSPSTETFTIRVDEAD